MKVNSHVYVHDPSAGGTCSAVGHSVVPRRIRRRPGRCVVSDGQLHSTVVQDPHAWILGQGHADTIKSRPEPDGLHHLGHPGEGEVCNTTQQHRRSEAGTRDGMVEFRRRHRAALAPLRRERFRGRGEDQRWSNWFIVPLLRCVHATEYVYQKSFEYFRSGPKYFQKSRGRGEWGTFVHGAHSFSAVYGNTSDCTSSR